MFERNCSFGRTVVQDGHKVCNWICDFDLLPFSIVFYGSDMTKVGFSSYWIFFLVVLRLSQILQVNHLMLPSVQNNKLLDKFCLLIFQQRHSNC